MKIINNITFHDDYDDIEITEIDIEKVKIRLSYSNNTSKFFAFMESSKEEFNEAKTKALNTLFEEKKTKALNYFFELCETYFDNEEEYLESDKHINDILIWNEMWLHGFSEEHRGDCTKDAFTCSRCYVERLLNLDTRPKKEK